MSHMNTPRASPRSIKQQSMKLEDDRGFMKDCSLIFKDNQTIPSEEAMAVMQKLNINLSEIQNISFDKFV